MNKETPMIKKLRLRFIALAMASLVVLLSVIVAGMNIINYNKVVSDADTRLEVLEQNSDRLIREFRMGADRGFGDERPMPDSGYYNDGDDDDFYFGRRGSGGPRMSRDEAEESRFFTVSVAEDGSVQQVNTDRIYAIDASEAKDYVEKALASGSDAGFVDEFRFSVKDISGAEENTGTDTSTGTRRITFLDCGRVLDSFRDFLRYSVLMSLAGLVIMFAVIVYFAGRIVRPVAESYEKQKRFITDAGHEIKTPLAIIKANIDLMNMDLEELAGEETRTTEAGDVKGLRDSLEDIDAQVDRLTDLTNDLVYLSRMEEGGSNLVMTDVPFSEIVSEISTSFEALAKDSDKSIETDIAPLLTVQGSTRELEKLVSILLQNAVKYAAEDEPIRLSLRCDGKSAVLEVANKTKETVSDENLSHVFERFYRTDESRNSATGGHGIGLSMANAIVSAHKGRIAARTTDGSDFIITVTLPL